MQAAVKMNRAQLDYLADVFGDLVPWPTSLEAVADKLEATNPRFDRDKFIRRATERWESNHPFADEIPY